MSVDQKLLEFLELVHKFEVEERPIDLLSIAAQLNCNPDEVKIILREALSLGLVEYDGKLLNLSAKARSMIHSHREEYIHNRYRHGLLARLSELMEGQIKDWRGHWRDKHGIDNVVVDDFYQRLGKLKGRVEETMTLTNLNVGKKAVVAFTLGGHGMVRRLAEMGLTPGTEVTVVRRAPFHGPIEVRVRGVSLALGRGVASKIFVKVLEEDAES